MHHYCKSTWLSRTLTRLLEALNQRIPSNQRKFLQALANTVADPDRRNNLGSFPQWRLPG